MWAHDTVLLAGDDAVIEWEHDTGARKPCGKEDDMSVALALKDETKEGGVETVVTKSEGTKQGCVTAPFKVSPLYEGDTTVDLTDPFYSEENMRRIDEAEQRIREGRVVIKTMEELEAMAR